MAVLEWSAYWPEFLSIALLHLMAVMSPGPDFAVVTRYAISYGRNLGLWISAGIGLGILVHIAYSLLGVALLIHRYEWIYLSVLLIGALYLGYLGIQAIQAKQRTDRELTGNMANVEVSKGLSARKALLIGFFTNALNVKATLFFLALFSTVIAPTTPTVVKLGYGLYMTLATALWFSLLTVAMTWGPFYRKLWRVSHWVDRLMGLALILLSLHLLTEFIGAFSSP